MQIGIGDNLYNIPSHISDQFGNKEETIELTIDDASFLIFLGICEKYPNIYTQRKIMTHYKDIIFLCEYFKWPHITELETKLVDYVFTYGLSKDSIEFYKHTENASIKVPYDLFRVCGITDDDKLVNTYRNSTGISLTYTCTENNQQIMDQIHELLDYKLNWTKNMMIASSSVRNILLNEQITELRMFAPLQELDNIFANIKQPYSIYHEMSTCKIVIAQYNGKIKNVIVHYDGLLLKTGLLFDITHGLTINEQKQQTHTEQLGTRIQIQGTTHTDIFEKIIQETTYDKLPKKYPYILHNSEIVIDTQNSTNNKILDTKTGKIYQNVSLFGIQTTEPFYFIDDRQIYKRIEDAECIMISDNHARVTVNNPYILVSYDRFLELL